jgi:FkbM family methyltransferase
MHAIELLPPPVRRLGRRTANRLGFDIDRDPFPPRLIRLCVAAGVDTVVDVGANTGQYAGMLRAAGFAGRVVSCEPLSAPYRKLAAAAARHSTWEAVHTALGDRDGTIMLHVAGNSQSSSVLDMLPAHLAAAPESRYVGVEEAPLTTVDELCERYRVEPARCLLKLDVQGYEGHVLAGAAGVLRRLAAVQVELSLAPLYDTQPLMLDVVTQLAGYGLDLWAIEPGFTDFSSGRMLQCDGVFVSTGRPAPGDRGAA